MLTEPLPIDLFIKIHFQNREFQRHIEDWPVESADIQRIVIATFEDMGIYTVPPNVEAVMLKKVEEIILKSPDIKTMVIKAVEIEKRRKRQYRQNIQG